MGKIQSAAGRATVATGALASKIGNTVFKMMGEAGEAGNSDIQMQESANTNSQQVVEAKKYQSSNFANRLGATGTTGGGGTTGTTGGGQ